MPKLDKLAPALFVLTLAINSGLSAMAEQKVADAEKPVDAPKLDAQAAVGAKPSSAKATEAKAGGSVSEKAAAMALANARKMAMEARHKEQSAAQISAHAMNVTPEYALAVARKVNDLVTREYFDPAVVESQWRPAYEKLVESLKNRDSAPKTLIELDNTINQTIKSLKTSHCQFETLNDETFFFLHSLFGTFNRRLRSGPSGWARPIACTGMATGGCGFDDNQVRYVLDHSPAAKAGLIVGDKIKSVDGKPYIGYLDFLGKAEQPLKLSVDRPGEHGTHEKELILTPVRQDLYSLYVDATKASTKTIKQGKYSFGYIHLWAGGSKTAEAVSEILTNDLKDVDGLVYDLRDGYGGASFEDLDLFFRPRAGFPDCISKDRSGRVVKERMYFDKPTIVLINGGSRSGKEFLAYCFKNSGRAKLVGETTAGFVVAGKLTPIDGRCALYLAVTDISLEGKEKVRLEGVGVAPDIDVPNKTHDQIGYGLQLKCALEALEKQLAGQN